MVTRRTVLSLAALPVLKPQRGSIVAVRPGARTVHAKVDTPIKPTSVELIPIDNPNTVLALRRRTRRAPE